MLKKLSITSGKRGNTQRWRDQFKLACMLSPQVDENGVIDDITTIEALTHFAAIGWKVLFALVPPAHYWKGWPAFFVSLFFIGAVTAIVGEFAALLGCVINLKQSLTAISIVALGTSLPDTFASRQAALESDNADVAIGNIYNRFQLCQRIYFFRLRTSMDNRLIVLRS